MGKIVFVIIGVVCLLSIVSLVGGVFPYIDYGTPPPSTYPIEVLARERIGSLSTDTFKFTTPNGHCCAGATPLHSHYIDIDSTLKRTDIKDVEKDLLEVFPRALAMYNDIPEIRPYLEVYPITSKDMAISISYGPSPETYYALPYYCFVAHWTNNNVIEFRRWENPSMRALGGQPGVDKSLWDFPKLVELSTLGVPRSKGKSPTPIIVDKIIKSPIRPAERLVPVLRDLCARYDIHMSALAHCAIGKRSRREISAGLWAQKRKMPLEEAKGFAEKFIEDYLSEIRRNKVVEKSHRKDSEQVKDLQKDLDWFCFRITFWDGWLNRVEEPYIAQIQCQDGKILYFTADEGQRLKQVFEEPVPQRFFPQGK